MNLRSSTFEHHVKLIIRDALRRNLSKEKVAKLVEIAERWEERRLKNREEAILETWLDNPKSESNAPSPLPVPVEP